ncbi:MAG: glycoside hydrolase family 3 C-terminal domain-containing protein, partial [Saprospiraceae bacterium]
GKVMGSAAVKGYEEDGLGKTTSVASCMKHYMGYSNPRNGKDRTPAYIPEIELREHYLPQFRDAVASGASSVMINSSLINGVPTHGDKYLLTNVLRKELGFKGVAVSDWEDIKRLYTWHKVASSPLDAVVIGVNAGVDMSMVPYDFSFATLLLEAVNKKLVSMERIDEAVRRILTMKYNVGLFANPYPEKEAIGQFGKPEYKDFAFEAAAEATTLLKNTNNILPLKPGIKILVAGPSAQSKAALNGAWSYTWQGKDEKWYPESELTILEAFQQKIGRENVITTSGIGYDDPANFEVKALRDAAQNVDAVVLCLGENAYAESPGNIFTLDMPTEQKELIRAAKSSGKPVIVVLNQGRPLFITDMVNEMDAILLAYWSGSGGAKAIVSTIMGDNNPSGILPFSYPKYPGDIVLYDHIFTETIREVFNNNVGTGYDPLFAFGFGLSYTTFEYSDLKLSDNKMSANTTIKVSVTVQNTGTKQGKHSVELYTHDQYATIAPSVRRLRAFQKIELKAGEKKTVTFDLNAEDLEFVNAQLKRVTEPGEFDVMIGELKGTFDYR